MRPDVVKTADRRRTHGFNFDALSREMCVALNCALLFEAVLVVLVD